MVTSPMGYDGIFVDDVNLEMRVSNGNGAVRPIDTNTGAPMTDAAWRRYMAEFVEELRAAAPNAHIAHNSMWWMDRGDEYVRRQVVAADAIELERGFNDGGITGGGGIFGYETMLSHVDWLHSQGAAIILEPYNLDRESAEYELASYFLVKENGDAIASDYRANPDNWWDGWETDLGASRSSYRKLSNGLFQRCYAGGMVLTNQPDQGTITKGLSSKRFRWTTLEGARVRRVTLGAREGLVLIKTPNPA